MARGLVPRHEALLLGQSDGDRGTLEVVGGHEGLGPEAGQAPQEAVGDSLEPRVVVGGDIVEVTASQGDPLLRIHQVFLQAQERVLGASCGYFSCTASNDLAQA